MQSMSNKLINRKWQSLIKSESKYKSAIGDMEAILVDKIIFEFGIEDLSSDGFCIVNINNESLAGLEACIGIIEEKGILSQEDHKNISI